MIYGVFGGCYSDWYCKGYFENKSDAEKYCVNSKEDLYVMEMENLSLPSKWKNTKVYKLHEITFNYSPNGKYTMRNEPDRYYIQNDESYNRTMIYNTNPKWISFKYVADHRESAEKVAQDLMGIIMSEYIECSDIKEAIKSIKHWNSKHVNDKW